MKVMAVELTLPDINLGAVGVVIALVVVAIAALATWLPARQAVHVDPMISLRTEQSRPLVPRAAVSRRLSQWCLD
jgi:hypothetical protein